MKIDRILLGKVGEETAQGIEGFIQSGDYAKITFREYEALLNTLFITTHTDIIHLINSYYSRIVEGNPVQFFHLEVRARKVSAPCRDMIQNYRYIFMYNRYMDCSGLLSEWSPTEPYFPLLKYIQDSGPDRPIDYTYWLRDFKSLPTALKFLRQNSIKIDFTDRGDLVRLYRTIPQMYISDFISLLGTKSWYMDAIKETDHFLDEVEKLEDT